MLFKPEQKEHIGNLWQQLATARIGAGNLWQEDWQPTYVSLEAAFTQAKKTDTPKAWNDLCESGRAMRERMLPANGEDTKLYLKLVALTDAVTKALNEAVTPTNLVPKGELRVLIERVERQIELTQDERRHTSQRDMEQRLDEIEEVLKEGKDELGKAYVKIDKLTIVEININELIAAIRDGIILVKNALELLYDPRFTEPLRKGAQKLWRTTKRFWRAAKDSFAAFRVSWNRDAADDYFEGEEPTFDPPPAPSIPFLVRDGLQDKHIRRVPGAGELFQDSWEENGRRFHAPEMVVVPAGEFLMGSPQNEAERSDNEGPQHKVIISQPFAIGVCAVTFDEWNTAQADNDWRRITGIDPRKPDDRNWGGDNHPVINVNHKDAEAYVKWLSEKTGKDYCLPTEAQWEYACRAGTTTPFWWGSTITSAQANYEMNRGKTLPVKSYDPNPWGLYQVHGNVWEWCADDGRYYRAEAVTDPVGSIVGARRALRGGSWHYDARFVRAASRIAIARGFRYYGVGFRCARVRL